jgi:hypothetical protein
VGVSGNKNEDVGRCNGIENVGACNTVKFASLSTYEERQARERERENYIVYAQGYLRSLHIKKEADV